ncbi:chitin-inducible gibberellin-responsive protein 2 isoform X2 [Cryptomeria japonica]|uniref:chitin-inducible gibberellin-responsive protein 2 isoform X2 n=1 Tax=Cryptomeria japonica TaxID=3369 RepID=UPI0027DAA5B8|nr:chitin-inducible gibberellin-responsive protein 2 isoform X2 [Cryptomeria japonica]
MAHECIGRAPKLIQKRSPISTFPPQEVGSESLSHIKLCPESYKSDKDQSTHVSFPSISQINVSLKGQEFFYEALPRFNGNSPRVTPYLENFLSHRSSISSQPQSCYLQDIHVPRIPSAPTVSRYSTDKISDVRHTLEGLEGSHIISDSVDACNVEAIHGDHKWSGNSDWCFNYIKTMKIQAQEFNRPQDDIQQLLIACAKAVANSDVVKAEKLIAHLRQGVSIKGNPMQRLGAYMVEGLEARLRSTGPTIYKRSQYKEPDSVEFISYFQILNAACPPFKFGYVAANGAIAEALKDKNRIHIVDFHIAEGNQWVSLIQALGRRKVLPSHMRITGIEDPESEYARDGRLHLVGQRLSKLAESCNIPFEFHPLPLSGSDVKANMLEVRDGEALAVNFAFQLHQMPDESVSTNNHRDRLIQMVRKLNPKMVTLLWMHLFQEIAKTVWMSRKTV